MSKHNARNKFVEAHYRANYSVLVTRFKWRVQDNSLALAEEVVQEAYLRAIKYFNKFDQETGSFDQWFSSILNNCCNQMKKDERSKGVVHELDAIEEYHELPEELKVNPVGNRKRFRVGLNSAIQKENERNRMIMTMFFIDGFPVKDISEFVGVTESNVRVIVHRFREKLIALPKGII